jgi:trehalose/maltose hydrolase-like predicted phosphorylase
MAWALQRAFNLLDRMSPEAREQLRGQMRLTQAELKNWGEIAHNLSIPLSKDGILEQYDGYFELQELDWESYRQKYDNIHRMDRILKAEGKSPDAYKVAKQADALMTFYVLSDKQVKAILNQLGYPPPDDLLRANFDYYLQRTSHGSTLSRLVHAYLAQIIGDEDLSWQLYMEALKSDYVDIQGGTTKEGIHAGVMTGTVLFSLRAFAGVDYDGETLKLNPKLPAAWRELCFSIGFKGDRYLFEIRPDTIKVRLESQQEKAISIFSEEIILAPGQWTSIEHI